MTTATTFRSIFEGQKFDLGRNLMTCGIESLVLSGFNPLAYLRRHAQGDWGDMVEEDKHQNERALNPDEPSRVHSAYKVSEDLTIWIITEWDRSVTTVLLPSEY